MPHLWGHRWQGLEGCWLPVDCNMERRHEWYQVCLGHEIQAWGSSGPSGVFLYSDLPQQALSPAEKKRVG